MWYFYPSGFFNIKYKVVKGEDLKNTNGKKGNLYIVCHDDNPLVDVMIISNEVKKIKKKSHLIAGNSGNFTWINYLPKLTPYNIIRVKDGNTTKKCIDIINNNENVFIFLKSKRTATGIYHILSETKARAILVKKNLDGNYDHNNKKFKMLTNVFGSRNEIKYIDYVYNLKENPKEFISNITKRLKEQ